MAIKYVIGKGVNLKNRDEAVFQSRCKQVDHLSMMRLAMIISDQTSVTVSDVLGVISNLGYMLSLCMFDSKIVRLNHFGSLRMVIKGKSIAPNEKWKPSMIDGMRVVFTPGSQFQSMYRSAEFQSAGKSASLSKPTDEPTEEPGEDA